VKIGRFRLAFLGGRGKTYTHYMQTQDAPAEIIFKFWPWFEANRKRLIIAGVIVAVAACVWFFISTQQQQKAMEAGKAYTQFQLNMPSTSSAQQVADGFAKIASQYAGTLAGERARLQVGATLFSGNQYADAQAQFASFLAAEKGSTLAVQAQYGIGACLEAQGKLDAALPEYRKVVTGFPDSTEATAAKFSQGRVLELQGKLTEAVNFYQETVRSSQAGSSLASEASQRIALLQVKIAAEKPASKS
jgi:predicted negative regulator of RcsB-dependent stress response